MKTPIALCLLASVAESFVVLPQHHKTTTLLRDTIKDSQEQWKEEAAIGHAFENSLESDPDMDGVVEHHKDANYKYLEQEQHKHDSLFDEIEHAVFGDPDLANVVGTPSSKREKKLVNQGFMDKEAHVHDSLLNEIEHSLDNDSDL